MKLLRKYAEKKIIGLNYSGNDETRWAQKQSGLILPLAAGIQVSESYREDQAHGLGDKTHRSLIEYLRRKDVEIIPLVREELDVENRAILFAQGALENDCVQDLKDDCNYSRFRYMKQSRHKGFADPAVMYHDKYFAKRAEKAIEFIDKNVTLDELAKLLAESDDRIVEDMLDKIRAIQPSLVVVSDMLAPRLAVDCFGYRLIRSPFARNVQSS